jgi:hypothetical protein
MSQQAVMTRGKLGGLESVFTRGKLGAAPFPPPFGPPHPVTATIDYRQLSATISSRAFIIDIPNLNTAP